MRTRPVAFVAIVAMLPALCACAPVDVSGSYTVSITNRENGCNLTGYTVGQSSTGIPFTVTQSGVHVTGTVGGLAAVALDLLLGSATFTGDHGLDLALQGTRAMSRGACAYTYDASTQGTLTGDAINGTIVYRAATNHAADCGDLETCTTTEAFSGSRPPR